MKATRRPLILSAVLILISLLAFDCDDGDPSVGPPSICIWQKLGSDLRVTFAASDSWYPFLAWTGSEFGVSWMDNRYGYSEIYFARVSSSGAKLGSDLRVTSAASYSGYPSLAWTGSEFGVSWMDDRDGNPEIYFGRISSTGTKIGADVRITNDANIWLTYYGWNSLAWTGSEFGVSWMDYRDNFDGEIYFARISSSGAKIGADVRITNDAKASMVPSLAWTGSEYGVSWMDEDPGNYEIYFARISADGTKIGADVRITNATGGREYPSLVWTGSEYGVSWEDNRDGNFEIYFARISGSGTKIGADVRITNDANYSGILSLVWTGSEFGVSWMDDRDGNDEIEIYFARISASGTKIGADVRITNDANDSYFPSLAWAGSEYGVCWMDHRDGNWEIYFARIGCQ